MYTDFSGVYTEDEYDLDVDVPQETSDDDYDAEYNRLYELKLISEERRCSFENIAINVKKQLYNLLEWEDTHNDSMGNISYQVVVIDSTDSQLIQLALREYRRNTLKLFSNLPDFGARSTFIENRMCDTYGNFSPAWIRESTGYMKELREELGEDGLKEPVISKYRK